MTDLSDETRNLIARGREGVPLTSERRSAIRAGVYAKLTGAAVAATTTLASTKTAAAAGVGAGWTTAALKVVGVVAAVATLGGATVAIVTYDRPVTEPSTSVTAVATAVAPSATKAFDGGSAGFEEHATPPTAASVAVAPPIHEAVVAAKLDAGRGTRRMSRDGRVAEENAVPTTATSIGAPAIADAQQQPNLSEAKEPGHSLEADVLLLKEAHRVLTAGDGAQALRLLAEHATRFPASTLEPERSAERVFALCQQKQLEAARAAADAFLDAHPRGPLATRVRGSCAQPTR